MTNITSSAPRGGSLPLTPDDEYAMSRSIRLIVPQSVPRKVPQKVPLLALLGTIVALACLPGLAQAAASPGDIHLDAPLSGWRNSSLDADAQNVEQEVHYPASDVNTREGQSRLALIAGEVRQAPKHKKGVAADAPGNGADQATGATAPATLIVNGVAMPLKVDEGIMSKCAAPTVRTGRSRSSTKRIRTSRRPRSGSSCHGLPTRPTSTCIC